MARKLVIAGGGTGGHIYPAIAIAHAIKEQDPDIEIHFVGATQGLEQKLVPKEGFPLHLMKVGKLNYAGGVFGKIKTLLTMPLVFLRCLLLLRRLKPEFVLGVGGFASGPFVATAALCRYPTAIWEPNAFPGLTNRWLSKFVDTSFVVFKEAEAYLKSREIVQTGLPVRKSLELLSEKPFVESVDSGVFHLLVFGGSQGARAINEVLLTAVQNPEWRQGIQIVHQTGVWDYEKVQSAYQGLEGVEAHEFLYDMDERYAWADLVLCRSGASTVAELSACGKAAILVPLPTAADDHQRKNAESLTRAEAAEMILQAELTPESLIGKILALKQDGAQRKTFEKNVKDFHVRYSARAIASEILKRKQS